MPHIYLCFLWHMHQPFYKDLISGEYKLPWTRLHALKDYYGMARILEEFPAVRQTFNLVPSMLVQVEEYAAGSAADAFLDLALKPAESLDQADRDFLGANSFHAHLQRMIYRYPRYGELYEAWQAQKQGGGVHRPLGVQDYRDLQVLSQLAWFDEEFQSGDAEVRRLIERGRDFTEDDKRVVAEKEREIMGRVLPAYRRVAASGQIEISTTPFYHPILPLLCDSDIAAVSHPGVPLPPRFRYPQDARKQLEMSREYIQRQFGVAPVGLWPSEGSVSDEALAIASELGFRWTATDSGVLARTMGHGIGVESIYRPYRWTQDGREIAVIFRDHFLSDLIGFVYSKMNAAEAAGDFLNRIRENCRGIAGSGRDALVPIMLDGENAWEYYEGNGRPFLRELYGRISEAGDLSAVTVAEAIGRLDPAPLNHIFPGSWINANFDVWIGAEEDNQAWAQLLRARRAFDETPSGDAAGRPVAAEELLIAEGSDWCWWYGPEHESANRPEFDQLYRSHLANVYHALGRTPPDELSRPILRVDAREVHFDPTGPVSATIDGEITSYFEWIGSGVYRVDARSGAMHGKKVLLRELYYGRDSSSLYIRADFQDGSVAALDGVELRLTLVAGDPPQTSSVTVRIDGGRASLAAVQLARGDPNAAECALRKVLEIRVALSAIAADAASPVRLQCSLWAGGLPIDSIPHHDSLEVLGTTLDWTP